MQCILYLQVCKILLDIFIIILYNVLVNKTLSYTHYKREAEMEERYNHYIVDNTASYENECDEKELREFVWAELYRNAAPDGVSYDQVTEYSREIRHRILESYASVVLTCYCQEVLGSFGGCNGVNFTDGLDILVNNIHTRWKGADMISRELPLYLWDLACGLGFDLLWAFVPEEED